MMNIKDIRVVQKLRKGIRVVSSEDYALRVVPSEDYVDIAHVEHFVEKTSWTLQIKRDGFAAEWEDVQVIEEYEDD